MKVCFPIHEDKGLDSAVYDHFGSAPGFIVVNTEQQSTLAIGNRDVDHVHGACNPVMAVGGHKIDAVVVGGIGAGALRKLNADGIKVYRSMKETVKDNLELFRDGRLPELSLHHACSGHQGSCGH
ncbi:MAG TPA: NifB/NifX family molybdenum-iron cluster-binding protein [Syntrophales bacterium]|nr:NifB/NifX family molybdenum-iron cluster-binding protein [Syntrophales bacterium]